MTTPLPSYPHVQLFTTSSSPEKSSVTGEISFEDATMVYGAVGKLCCVKKSFCTHLSCIICKTLGEGAKTCHAASRSRSVCMSICSIS